jgi:hexosaminidase
VYSWDPIPPVLTQEQAAYIIGVQGNVWTEYMKTTKDVELKVFPRAIALAEIAWSAQKNRNWNDFQSRMENQYPRLDYKDVKYSTGSYLVGISTKLEGNKNLVVLTSEKSDIEIRYTIDGTEPGPASILYQQPFELNSSAGVKAITVSNKVVKGIPSQQNILVNLASGKPVSILKPYSFKYPANGDQAMTDGLLGLSSYKSGWQGYEGSDAEFVVDLLQPTTIKTVRIRFVKNPSDWVLFPEKVQFAFSLDGHKWNENEPILFDAGSPSKKEIKIAENNFSPVKYRFVKVIAISPKILPAWHEFNGKPCWIFCDELEVE